MGGGVVSIEGVVGGRMGGGMGGGMGEGAGEGAGEGRVRVINVGDDEKWKGGVKKGEKLIKRGATKNGKAEVIDRKAALTFRKSNAASISSMTYSGVGL